VKSPCFRQFQSPNSCNVRQKVLGELLGEFHQQEQYTKNVKRLQTLKRVVTERSLKVEGR